VSDERISDPALIAGLLAGVQRQQLPVQLLAPAAGAPEPSLLLVADAGGRELLFDAPRGLDSGAYQPGEVLTVLTSHHGAELRFDTTILAWEHYAQYPALRTRWPRSILSRQRRKAFRVRIGDDRSSRLELYDESGDRLRGRLADLSVGGFGALIDLDTPLQVGEELDSVLEVDDLSLSATIIINDLRIPAKGRFLRVGAAFQGLKPQQQAQVERLVRALERRAIRGDDSHH
jgi:flagellar brake protein